MTPQELLLSMKKNDAYKVTGIDETENGLSVQLYLKRRFVKEDSSSETFGYKPMLNVITNTQGSCFDNSLNIDQIRDWFISFDSFASHITKQKNLYTARDTIFEKAVERFKKKYPTLCKDNPCFIQNSQSSMYVLLKHGTLVYKYSVDKIKYIPNRNKAYF